MPSIDLAEAVVRERHVAPFAAAVAAGARAIMVGHLDVRALDPGTPATISPRVVDGFLRGTLGFRGACFTDCLEMKAIAETIGTARAAARAIAAGVDCVVISHTLALARAARDEIVAAVERGEHRARTPRRGGPSSRGAPVAARRRRRRRRGRERGRAQGRHAGPRAGDGPRRTEEERAGHGDFVRGRCRDRRRRRRRGPSVAQPRVARRGVRSELLRVALEPSAEMIGQLARRCIAMQRGRRVLLLSRSAQRHPRQREALRALLTAAPEATLVALLDPFDAAALGEAATVLCTYGDGEIAVEALADVLAGRAAATGRLPVTLGAA